MSARDGRELTVLMRGCDGKLTKGYHFCSLAAGTVPDREISLFFPQTNCGRDFCVEWQFLNRDGSLGLGGSLPRGLHSKTIRLSEILGHSLPLAEKHGGEYRILAKVWYKDTEGLERRAEIQGIFRLWVHQAAYTRLVCGDPETGWRLKIEEGCEAHFSTNGRTALCGKGCLIDGRTTR